MHSARDTHISWFQLPCSKRSVWPLRSVHFETHPAVHEWKRKTELLQKAGVWDLATETRTSVHVHVVSLTDAETASDGMCRKKHLWRQRLTKHNRWLLKKKKKKKNCQSSASSELNNTLERSVRFSPSNQATSSPVQAAGVPERKSCFWRESQPKFLSKRGQHVRMPAFECFQFWLKRPWTRFPGSVEKRSVVPFSYLCQVPRPSERIRWKWERLEWDETFTLNGGPMRHRKCHGSSNWVVNNVPHSVPGQYMTMDGRWEWQTPLGCAVECDWLTTRNFATRNTTDRDLTFQCPLT